MMEASRAHNLADSKREKKSQLSVLSFEDDDSKYLTLNLEAGMEFPESQGETVYRLEGKYSVAIIVVYAFGDARKVLIEGKIPNTYETTCSIQTADFTFARIAGETGASFYSITCNDGITEDIIKFLGSLIDKIDNHNISIS